MKKYIDTMDIGHDGTWKGIMEIRIGRGAGSGSIFAMDMHSSSHYHWKAAPGGDIIHMDEYPITIEVSPPEAQQGVCISLRYDIEQNQRFKPFNPLTDWEVTWGTWIDDDNEVPWYQRRPYFYRIRRREKPARMFAEHIIFRDGRPVAEYVGPLDTRETEQPRPIFKGEQE